MKGKDINKIEPGMIITPNNNSNVQFRTIDYVDFKFSSSFDPTEITPYEADETTGEILYWLLKKQATAVSGIVKSQEFTFGDPKPYDKITLEELNADILLALEEHNNLLLTGRNYSRRQQFEEVERSALEPLPLLRYELKKQIFVTVMKNGHVSLNADKHYYSVPYRFIGKKIKLMYSNHTVDIFYHYERIAQHERIKSPYNYTTDKEHLASSHRFVSDWTPERFLNWAFDIHEEKYWIENSIQNKPINLVSAY